MITPADICTRRPGDWHAELEPFMCVLLGRTSRPAKGFAWIWDRRQPGTLSVTDNSRALIFQLRPTGKLYLLPHREFVEDPDELIAPEIRRRNPPTEIRAN